MDARDEYPREADALGGVGALGEGDTLGGAGTQREAVTHSDSSVTTQGEISAQKLPGTAIWLLLIAIGFALEFAGRLLGLRGNPTGIWLEVAPLFTTIIAASLIVFAVLRVMQAYSEKNLQAFRLSLLLCMLGTSMLVFSFISKSIVASVFLVG